MNNFNYAKKYHYILKYVVLAFPLIVYLISSFSFSDLGFNSTINNGVMQFMSDLLALDISVWYKDLLIVLSSDIGNTLAQNSLTSFLLIYPLYVFYVYLFDLVLDVFVFIPKLFHHLASKLIGGGKYE